MNASHTLEAGNRNPARPVNTPSGPERSAGDVPSGHAGARGRDADGMAVAAFVLGLTGLLFFNLVLGPCALILGGLALLRGTARRGRALLGMSLGAADLVVLAVAVSANQAMSWSFTG